MESIYGESMNKVLEMLKTTYHVHCVILYGGRSTDSWFPDSDYDFLCIRENGEKVREILSFDDKTIDLIVDDESIISDPENFIYLWSHKILLDEKGFGKKLVEVHQKR